MNRILVIFVFLSLLFGLPIYYPKTAYAQEQSINLPVRAFAQEQNLSCEVATARMLLAYYGHNIDEATLQSALPLNENPYLGFRGNVDGRIGFDNYGVYAVPIVDILNSNGVHSTAYFSVDENFVKQKLAEGKPVIIWGTARLKNRGKTIYPEVDNQKVKIVLGEHTYLIHGYDNGRFLVNDSIGGRQYNVASLNSLGWNSLDRMTIVPD